MSASRTIHALVARIGMPDEDYRALLWDRFHAESSKALTPTQSHDLVVALHALLPADQRAEHPHPQAAAGARRRFESLAGRDDMATPAQLRMLEASFVQRSRALDLASKQLAFRNWLSNRFGIDRVEWIPRDQVGKILRATQGIDRDASPPAPQTPFNTHSNQPQRSMNMAKKDKDGNWIDARGRGVPVEYVKEQDQRRDAMIEKVHSIAKKLEKEIAAARLEITQEVDLYLEWLAKENKVKEGWKGNITLDSFDGSLRVVRNMDDQVGFSESLHLVKTQIDLWLKDQMQGANASLVKVVSSAFNVDKKGKVNTAMILRLLTLDITDAKWRKAMQVLRDSIQVTATRQYLSFAEKIATEEGGETWRPVVLNFVGR